MNRQSAASNLSNLTREQKQVLLTGRLGDGNLSYTPSGFSVKYQTNCKFEEYIDYKGELLGSLMGKKFYKTHNGFCQTPIWSLYSKSLPILRYFKEASLGEILEQLDDLGLALWLYDDGSLHQKKLFYNLNTQRFSETFHREVLVPYFKNKWDITVTPTIERKQDGREFWYCRIKRYEGAYIISQILAKYPVPCYNYKIISSETIQKWSKLQEELKRAGKDYHSIHPHTLTMMLTRMSL